MTDRNREGVWTNQWKTPLVYPAKRPHTVSMIFYLLGVTTGLMAGCLVFLAALWQRPVLVRTVNQLHSSLKAEGKILDIEVGEVEGWVKGLEHE